MGNLINLISLWLYHNPITEIPQEIKNIPKLTIY